MNHNLYRAGNYIIHRDYDNHRHYFAWFKPLLSDGQKRIPEFLPARSRAARIIRFFSFLSNILLIYQYFIAESAEDIFWQLQVDCCFSNGAFKTVRIDQLLDKNKFPFLYKKFLEQGNIGPEEFLFHLDYKLTFKNVREAIFQALLDNRIYRKYEWLLIFPESNRNRSSDYPYAELQALNIDVQRLKIYESNYRGFLFKSKEDINFSLLAVVIPDEKKVIDLKIYSNVLFDAMLKDLSYNDKISSIV